ICRINVDRVHTRLECLLQIAGTVSYGVRHGLEQRVERPQNVRLSSVRLTQTKRQNTRRILTQIVALLLPEDEGGCVAQHAPVDVDVIPFAAYWLEKERYGAGATDSKRDACVRSGFSIP